MPILSMRFPALLASFCSGGSRAKHNYRRPAFAILVFFHHVEVGLHNPQIAASLGLSLPLPSVMFIFTTNTPLSFKYFEK